MQFTTTLVSTKKNISQKLFPKLNFTFVLPQSIHRTIGGLFSKLDQGQRTGSSWWPGSQRTQAGELGGIWDRDRYRKYFLRSLWIIRNIRLRLISGIFLCGLWIIRKYENVIYLIDHKYYLCTLWIFRGEEKNATRLLLPFVIFILSYCVQRRY